MHPERVELLAYHFSLGAVWDKAADYHRQAGDRAAALHAYPAALSHYDRAVALAEAAGLPDTQRFDLLAAREATLNVLGQRERQAADLETMARLAQDAPQRRLQVYRRRAWLLLHTSRFAECEAMARQMLTLARQWGDLAHQAAALTVLGTAIHQRGDMLQAIPTLRTAIALYRQVGDLRGEAKAYRALAAAFHGTGAYTAAREAVAAALSRYEALDDQVGRAEGLTQLGALHMEQGEPEQAIACYHRALEICDAIGYRYEQAKGLTNLGNVYYFQDRLTQALRCYDEAIRLFASIGERRGEAFARANAATVRHTMLGDDEAAARDAEIALAFYVQVGDRAGEGQCLDTLGGIAFRQGDLATARERWQTALMAMQAVGDRWGEISVLRSLAALALAEGRPQPALEHLDAAMALCRDLGLADRAIALQAERGTVLLALGRPEAALAATTQAMAQLRPSVEQAYLVPFAHYQVLAVLGRHGDARTALEQAHRMLSEALRGLSPEERAMSLEQVTEHRAIVAAWEAIQPRRVTLRLPAASAPTGRPLRDDEYVEVIWTVAAPEDEEVPGKVARRRHRLLRLLREAADQAAAPTVAALAEALGVSARTIKRDLASLRQSGREVHTRGSR
ncbi:MAG: tetratricopeptide repeat protein [Ardenticatenia bacterium]|nr:tetratricopeptide repeat protein [Ardenticatenia bacterium]